MSRLRRSYTGGGRTASLGDRSAFRRSDAVATEASESRLEDWLAAALGCRDCVAPTRAGGGQRLSGTDLLFVGATQSRLRRLNPALKIGWRRRWDVATASLLQGR